ncbi:major facilitator superfamily domain-containing protein [Schizophyllum commune]
MSSLSSIDRKDASVDAASVPALDAARVMRKIDLHVLPYICVMYTLAFLDRVNISNAVLFGLKDDLKLVGNQYSVALVIFFVPYILCEVPSNIFMKRLRPHVWLSICMFGFGLVTMLQGFVFNWGGLMTTRWFLGVFEAGMFPGCFYLLAMWYRREEAQKRYTFFFCSTTLAGAFGGLLASAIGKMDGLRGYRGWRWVFIIEGLVTAVVAIAWFFLLPDFPEESKFLTEEEKEWVRTRLSQDVGESEIEEKTTWRDALKVIGDYKVMVGALMYFGLIVPGYGYAYFAPTIISGFGYTTIRTQLLSVPPWAGAFVFAMCMAFASDIVRHRAAFAFAACGVCVIGFAVLLAHPASTNAQYGALFLAAAGAYTAMPLVVCWFNTNLAGHTRRGVGSAWQVAFGNIGGIVASFAFPDTDKPRFFKGYGLCLAFSAFTMIMICVYVSVLAWENRRRARSNDADDEKAKLRKGDLAADYRYMY